MRAMTLIRKNLALQLHTLYLKPNIRNYYIMNNLDPTLENPDQRLTNDLDLVTQFMSRKHHGA